LFMLYRQAVGLLSSGPPRIFGDLLPSFIPPAGFPLNLTVYPMGSQPFSYQWLFNGAPMADSAHVSGSQSQSLTVTPAFLGDAGMYQAIVSNSFGSATSALCSVTVGRDALSSAAGWSRNGRASPLTNNSVSLTDGNGGEASSVFLNSPQYIGAFVASYTYQDIGGGGADGCAFVLHNAPPGSWALGSGGGGLGYGGITPSLALEFNIYSSYGAGMALRSNGQTGAPYSSTTPVNVAGGNPIAVSLAYDGTTLSLSLTDTVTRATFKTNAALNISSVLGTNTAFVGLTGADGGISSRQVISKFQFASLTSLASQVTGTNAVLLTWPNSAGGLVLQQTPSFGSNWMSSTDSLVLNSNGNNQVSIPAPAGQTFYRLATP